MSFSFLPLKNYHRATEAFLIRKVIDASQSEAEEGRSCKKSSAKLTVSWLRSESSIFYKSS